MRSLQLWKFLGLLSLTVVLSTGCATQQPYDYSALLASKPRSILVIPPQNNTVEVNAPYIFLSTISAPLAEKGYYVFPVAVIDQFMKDNGLPTPAEMNSVPLDKLREHIGPDAVLYVTIDDWGQQYQIISSVAVVSSSWRLVDARSGETLWQGRAYAQQSSDGGNNGLAGMLVAAVIEQVVNSVSDKTPGLSANANYRTINSPSNGLLPGPYLKVETQGQ